MLARRLGTTSWPLKKNVSAWARSTFGWYADGLAEAVSSQHYTYVFSSSGNDVVYGFPATNLLHAHSQAFTIARSHPASDGLIDLAGTMTASGYDKPHLLGTDAAGALRIGRYRTAAGDVAVNALSVRPFGATPNGYSALGGGRMIRARTGPSGTCTYAVTDLVHGGETVVPGTFSLANSKPVSTGDQAWMIPVSTGSILSVGAGSALATTQVPASGTRPAALRYVRSVYDDAPVPLAFCATPGQGSAGFYPAPWQRPLTTGTLGRGIQQSIDIKGYAVRARTAYVRTSMTVYEYEMSASLGNGVDANGNAFTKHVLKRYWTTSGGYLVLADAGAYIPFWTRVVLQETDVIQYLTAGNPSGIYGNPTGGRVGATVSDVSSDVFPAGARDRSARAKGAPGFLPSDAIPGVVGQKYLLAVNADFIDRYTHQGVYVDRINVPFPTVRPYNVVAAGGTVPWVHSGVQENSAGGTDFLCAYYLAHNNLLCLPRNAQNPYSHWGTRDEGATWQAVTILKRAEPSGAPPAPVFLERWSGMHPMFPT